MVREMINAQNNDENVKAPLLKNKLFLYTTAFFSGMSVMAIELGASRLLAPYFSSSQIVWTVIIGTIMIALALGNVIGGRMADRDPDPARLYRRLLLAALWTAAIPFVGKYLIAAISLGLALFITHNFLVWASLVSCFVIFVFPLVLLGTTAPCLVKFSVNNLEENGRTVGELEALNTIGSIIGTFVPTFVTIPTVGTAATFLIFAAILALISCAYFVSAKKHAWRSGAAAGLILVLLVVPANYSFAFWEKSLAYEGESIYNYLQVKEDSERVILSTNVLVGVQSILMKNQRLTGMYYDYALAAPLMAGMKPVQTGINQTGADQTGIDQPKRNMLILGLGTGTYAKLCLELFEDLLVEGVEIDAKITQLAQEYFELPEAVQVSIYDGRAYLQNKRAYDVIMVDAYQDITIPFQMSTLEFFRLVQGHLKEGGVMVVNMNMRSSKEATLNDYLCDTISAVFPNVYTVTVANGTNTVLFASDKHTMLTDFASACAALEPQDPLQEIMHKVQNNLIKVGGGPLLLTDDKAPVELLGMKVMDGLIEENLQYYKDVLRSGKVEDLLEGLQ